MPQSLCFSKLLLVTLGMKLKCSLQKYLLCTYHESRDREWSETDKTPALVHLYILEVWRQTIDKKTSKTFLGNDKGYKGNESVMC